MNWTGGRLQRHSLGSRSNATKSLRAVQKQHFAKRRLAARCGRGSSVSPIKLLAIDIAQRMDGADNISGSGRGRARTRGKSRFFEADEGGGQVQDGDIEAIRRNLLRRNDWASLSLSRPLKMTFSSTRAERDNLAKRRRLTERDRTRLTAMRDGGDGYIRRISDLRRQSPSVFDPDAISIRIGQPGVRHRVSITPAPQSHLLSQATSNESMLFDGEERYRRTQSILVESSDFGRDLDEESVQQPMSQEMFVSDTQGYEAEDEREVLGERDQEESTLSTSESSIPLPVLHPCGSFQRDEDGQLRYEPPVPHHTESPAIPSGRGEDLLISSSPENPRIRRTQVPLWIPEEMEANLSTGPNIWQRSEIDETRFPWTSKSIRQPLEEEHPRAFRGPFALRPTRSLNGTSNKESHNSQRNLFFDHEESVSVLGSVTQQKTASIPIFTRKHDEKTQGRLHIDSEGHVSVTRRSRRGALPCGGRGLRDWNTPGEIGYCPAEDTQVREIPSEKQTKDFSLPEQTVGQNDDGSAVDGDAIWKNFVFV